MDSEQYDIKWKTFPDHLIEVFKELGEDGHFADVTLVSDDQIQTPAHKVVLSACSPVLKTLLVNNPHSHPLLYLRGIEQTELQAILQFMYFGETQIFQNRISQFGSVAKDLEVKEIFGEQEENDVPENFKKPPPMDDTYDNINVSNGDTVVTTETKVTSNRSVAKSSQRSVANNEGRFNCDECEATYSVARDVTRHKKSKHEGENVEAGRTSCEQCNTVFSNNFTLNRHSVH